MEAKQLSPDRSNTEKDGGPSTSASCGKFSIDHILHGQTHAATPSKSPVHTIKTKHDNTLNTLYPEEQDDENRGSLDSSLGDESQSLSVVDSDDSDDDTRLDATEADDFHPSQTGSDPEQTDVDRESRTSSSHEKDGPVPVVYAPQPLPGMLLPSVSPLAPPSGYGMQDLINPNAWALYTQNFINKQVFGLNGESWAKILRLSMDSCLAILIGQIVYINIF